MKNILLIAISLTFFACSSGGGSGFTYTCQLATSCIQLESVSDCNAAGGSVVDVCPFNSGGSSSPSGNSGSYGSVSHGGQTYKTVVIGTQTWMAENLNYNVKDSRCYGEDGYVYDDSIEGLITSENDIKTNCEKYGRLYDWATAKTVCPSGWHLPTYAEWTALENYVGGSSTASRYLKATNGWIRNGNGSDTYGFAALPGGNGDSDGNFYGIGEGGFWWTASEYNASDAYLLGMISTSESVYDYNSDKSDLFSVRCLQDVRQ